MSKLQHAISAAIGATYGGVTGAFGGGLGLTAGVIVGSVGGIASLSGLHELSHDKFTPKLRTFFASTVAGFGLAYIANVPETPVQHPQPEVITLSVVDFIKCARAQQGKNSEAQRGTAGNKTITTDFFAGDINGENGNGQIASVMVRSSGYGDDNSFRNTNIEVTPKGNVETTRGRNIPQDDPHHKANVEIARQCLQPRVG